MDDIQFETVNRMEVYCVYMTKKSEKKLKISQQMRRVVFFVFISLLIIITGVWSYIRMVSDQKSRRRGEMEERYIKRFGHGVDRLTLDRFAENGYETLDEFSIIVEDSKRASHTETILFVGLLRNNGRDCLQFWRPVIERLGAYFREYEVMFVENDSIDDTRQILSRLVSSDPHYTMFCPNGISYDTPECKIDMPSIQTPGDKNHKAEKRLETLTMLREAYLVEIKKMTGIDHVVVIDWDLQGDFSIEGFFHALSVMRDDPSLDGVAVNSFHRATMNLHDPFPLHSFKECAPYSKINDWKLQWKYATLFKKELSPVVLPSAFGGVAIYRFKSLIEKDPHYDVQERCRYECEHSNLHRNLRLALDPWFIFLIRKNLH